MDRAARARAAAADVRVGDVRRRRLDPRPHRAHHRGHRHADDADPDGAPDLRRPLARRAALGDRGLRRRRRPQRARAARRPAGGPDRAVRAAPGGPAQRRRAGRADPALGDFCVGVAAFPEGHPAAESADSDARYLAAKAAAPAPSSRSPSCSSGRATTSRSSSGSAPLGVDIPIIPGIMPITNLGQITRMAELSGAALPDAVVERVARLRRRPGRRTRGGHRGRHRAVRRRCSPAAHPGCTSTR